MLLTGVDAVRECAVESCLLVLEFGVHLWCEVFLEKRSGVALVEAVPQLILGFGQPACMNIINNKSLQRLVKARKPSPSTVGKTNVLIFLISHNY